jgi:hypothetical protein
MTGMEHDLEHYLGDEFVPLGALSSGTTSHSF